MKPSHRTVATTVVVAASVLSGCALWFGSAPVTLASETLLPSDAYMRDKFGFRVLPASAGHGEPATFNRVRRVYVKGSGPRVILLHELPGLRDGDIKVGAALAERFEVYMPLLFGTAGQDDTRLGTKQACRGGLFKCNDRDTRHPITVDLIAMARSLCGTAECGVLGMCLTGTVPLSMMEADGVVAVVLAQPTLPLVWHIWPFAGLDISEQDTATALAKAVERRASVYMVRYRGDWISGRRAFRRLVNRIAPLKDRLSFFAALEVPGRGHSTLVEDEDHPHVAAEQLKAVTDALNVRLTVRSR